MKATWISAIIAWLQATVAPTWIALFISMLPVFELRGGLIAARLMGLGWIEAAVFCTIGNLLPIPFVVLFFRSILNFLKKRTGLFRRFGEWLERKTLQNRRKLERYEVVGLILLVAIPLPGTGAWTGAMLASLLDMRLRRAVPLITIGVLIALMIMSVGAYLIPSFFV